MRIHRLWLAPIVVAAAAVAASACSKSDTAATASPSSACTVTLGSTTTSVSAAASTGTVPVTAATTCAWTAASSAAFLTVTSGASGTGNGSVGYSIAANTGAARSASIVVNGSTVVFSQAAQQLTAPASCAVKLSTTSAKANSGGATVNIDVTADSNCGWTATSNASFLSVPSGTVIGNGTMVITAAQNTGAARSGTVTIGGQAVTISQDPGVVAAFSLFDPGQTSGATNVCQFRSGGAANTCILRSTSFTGGASPIVSYTWTVQYTYGTVKVISSTGSTSSLSITDTCGLANAGATDEGALNPLDVTLTVTDSGGNTNTAKSGGSASQPNLFVQLFNCGK